MNFKFSLMFRLLLTLLVGSEALHLAAQNAEASRPNIGVYIHGSWDALERSTNECESVVDAKVLTNPVVYLPAGVKTPPSLTEMTARCDLEIKQLPKTIHRLGDLKPDAGLRPGLLYLPNPYVVPGGRFNEMYGWDSYFIILGLMEDGRVPLAKGMVENFFFEVKNYGAVLNANRTYFLTRSQPPLLTSMIVEIYSKTHDKTWLQRAYKFGTVDYSLWTRPDHRAGATGLARYYDLGAGPVPEMADDNTYYADVVRWLIAHPERSGTYLVKASEHPDSAEANRLKASSCDALASRACADAYAGGFRLSAAFFKGDRAMRESGFDTTFRFGPFSGSTDHYAPVCLNSLLYKYERDMAMFASTLGKRAEARVWRERAERRRRAILKFLWNPTIGTFSDYNFVDHKISSYRYLSEFYPLWAGLATQAQAEKVRLQLPIFEREGGLAMSDRVSSTQWDMPFGWAPTNWFAIEGLKRYGFNGDSNRLGDKFRRTVETNYARDGTIREKYNVVDGTANIAISAGYKTNVIGFGWTNGVYARLAHTQNHVQSAQSPSGDLTSLPPIPEQGSAEDRLRFALILSRHGVRPPLEQPSDYSSLPWPSWEVPLGHLTPHGAKALQEMGKYMGLVYTRAGLLSDASCSGAATVYLYSDNDERNISSTRATFHDFAPGCSGLPVHAVQTEVADPLFRSQSIDSLSPAVEEAARREALQAEHPNVFAKGLRTELQLLQQILTPPGSPPAVRSILDIAGDRSLSRRNILEASRQRSVASEIVEDLMLEYVDDKPLADVGWGRVDEATLRELMPIRISAFNLENRTLAFARIGRSNLLAHILDTLDQASKGVPIPGAIGPTGTKLVYISGHDSDLAGISGLLGLHWTADGRTDDTPPDSQIIFELWQHSAVEQLTIRIRYRGQSLGQLRTASQLTLSSAPDEVLMKPTGCASRMGCPWTIFDGAALKTLSVRYVKPQLMPSQVVPQE